MAASVTHLPRGVLLQVYGHDLLGTNQTATITNISASAGVITYTANNSFSVGDKVTISGVLPAAYNLKDVTIATRNSTQFTVANSATGTFVSGGTAKIISWNKVTEHNRQPIEVSTNRIEQVVRMSNGSLRKFFIADKKQFSITWTTLPGRRAYTADGFWGAEDLIKFYESVEGQETFNIRLNYAYDGTESFTTYNVNCTGFTSTLTRRGVATFWDITMSMEEV